MKFLLDTDHVSILQQPASAARTAIEAKIAFHGVSEIAYSLVSYHEQLIGAHTQIIRAKAAAAIVNGYRALGRHHDHFRGADLLPYDQVAETVFALQRRQGVRIGTMDLRIASIALARGLTVVSRNLRDFGQVPGLVVEDWTV